MNSIEEIRYLLKIYILNAFLLCFLCGGILNLHCYVIKNEKPKVDVNSV